MTFDLNQMEVDASKLSIDLNHPSAYSDKTAFDGRKMIVYVHKMIVYVRKTTFYVDETTIDACDFNNYELCTKIAKNRSIVNRQSSIVKQEARSD